MASGTDNPIMNEQQSGGSALNFVTIVPVWRNGQVEYEYKTSDGKSYASMQQATEAANKLGGGQSGGGGVALPGKAGLIGDIITGGTSLLGGILSGNAQAHATELSRQDQLRAMIATYLSELEKSASATQQNQASMGLTSTQMDPYAQAKDLNAANVRRSFAAGMTPTGFKGTYDLSALDPANLQRNADYFYKNVAEASPNVPLGDVSQSAEDFRQQRAPQIAAIPTQYKDLIMKYLTEGLGGPGLSAALRARAQQQSQG